MSGQQVPEHLLSGPLRNLLKQQQAGAVSRRTQSVNSPPVTVRDGQQASPFFAGGSSYNAAPQAVAASANKLFAVDSGANSIQGLTSAAKGHMGPSQGDILRPQAIKLVSRTRPIQILEIRVSDELASVNPLNVIFLGPTEQPIRNDAEG